MAIYTGVADGNGDFNIPFSTQYSGGQKITITAEKDNAEKSIELYAPSEVVGGEGAIEFTGSLNNFPNNVTGMRLTQGLSGVIKSQCFQFASSAPLLFRNVKTLSIEGEIETIESNAFYNWNWCNNLVMPDSLKYVHDSAFKEWNAATSVVFSENLETVGNFAFDSFLSMMQLDLSVTKLKVLTPYSFNRWVQARVVKLPSTLTLIYGNSLRELTRCEEIILYATTPPGLDSSAFTGLNTACIFKVPNASVDAYRAASGWSAFASRIQAI